MWITASNILEFSEAVPAASINFHFLLINSPEIPDFLDADECELIIALAENKRLRDNPKRTDSRGIFYEDPVNTFKLWDLNGDDYIDTEEVSGTVHPLLFVSVYCCLLNLLQSSVVSKSRFSHFTFSISLLDL